MHYIHFLLYYNFPKAVTVAIRPLLITLLRNLRLLSLDLEFISLFLVPQSEFLHSNPQPQFLHHPNVHSRYQHFEEVHHLFCPFRLASNHRPLWAPFRTVHCPFIPSDRNVLVYKPTSFATSKTICMKSTLGQLLLFWEQVFALVKTSDKQYWLSLVWLYLLWVKQPTQLNNSLLWNWPYCFSLRHLVAAHLPPFLHRLDDFLQLLVRQLLHLLLHSLNPLIDFLHPV